MGRGAWVHSVPPHFTEVLNQERGRDYGLDGEKKKSYLPVVEQVTFKNKLGDHLSCGTTEKIA